MIFIFLIIIFKISSKFIILEYKNQNHSNSTFFEKLLINNLITKIKIGTPFKQIECNFAFENELFIIPGSNYNSIYNEKKSSSFEYSEYFKTYNYSKKFDSGKRNPNLSGFSSKEIFSLNNEIIDLNFILPENFSLYSNNKNNFCQIGLKINGYYIIDDSNIINQLKLKNVINENCFSFDLKNNKIFIGDFLHRIFPKKFNEKDFFMKKIDYHEWLFKFNNVNFTMNNTNFIEHQIDCKFSINLNGIIAPETFYRNFKEFINFFIENKICFEDVILKNYIGFYCDKKRIIEYKKFFPVVNFYIKDINFTFVLDYNDYFYEFDNKIYLFIIFRKYGQCHWTLGKLFLKKYQITFDQEKKIVGFYKKINNDNNNIFDFIKTNYLTMFLIFFCVFISFVFLFYYFKNKNKKKYAFELNDDYEYLSKETKMEFKQYF